MTRGGPKLMGVLLILLLVARAIVGSSLAFADVQSRLCCAAHCSDVGVNAAGCDCCVVAPLPAEAAIPGHRVDQTRSVDAAFPAPSMKLPTPEQAVAALRPATIAISEPPLFLRFCNLRR